MTYRVEIVRRAARDLRILYEYIHAEHSEQARAWFNELEALIYSLDEHPARGAVTAEDNKLRHLIYGNKNTYRVIYAIDEASRVVSVLHIRHSARDAFTPADLR